MSTKQSLAWGDDFHFYKDMFVEDTVYLQLRGEEIYFDASPDSVTVAIPFAVWELIRERAPVDLSAASLSDLEIATRATAEIDAAQGRWTKHKNECKGSDCRVHFLFEPHIDRESQSAYWRKERRRQQALVEQINKYKEGLGPKTLTEPARDAETDQETS